MSERLTALYRGATVCAFDLWDENGQYIEEIRSELREASQDGGLVCPECQSRLILCAGAIREPYFRHFELKDCHLTFELRTKAGQRSYHCRKILYDLAKRSKTEHLLLEEKSTNRLKPILFEVNEEKYGYVYLDGKTRNYRELREINRMYVKEGYRLFFFLPAQYRSQGRNLTSDEAEILLLNKGLLFYIDWENSRIFFRKRYEDCNHIAQYFSEVYAASDLTINKNGEIAEAFLKAYAKKVREEKLQFIRVLRLPAEDGVDEIYEEMDYVLMDALEEIWILPKFRYKTEDEETGRANRIAYLQQMNEILWESQSEREEMAYTIQRQIENHLNSWDWS